MNIKINIGIQLIFLMDQIVIGTLSQAMTQQGDFGPTAVNNKLGWLLSGLLDDVLTTSTNSYVSNLIIPGDTENAINLLTTTTI